MSDPLLTQFLEENPAVPPMGDINADVQLEAQKQPEPQPDPETGLPPPPAMPTADQLGPVTPPTAVDQFQSAHDSDVMDQYLKDSEADTKAAIRQKAIDELNQSSEGGRDDLTWNKLFQLNMIAQDGKLIPARAGEKAAGLFKDPLSYPKAAYGLASDIFHDPEHFWEHYKTRVGETPMGSVAKGIASKGWQALKEYSEAQSQNAVDLLANPLSIDAWEKYLDGHIKAGAEATAGAARTLASMGLVIPDATSAAAQVMLEPPIKAIGGDEAAQKFDATLNTLTGEFHHWLNLAQNKAEDAVGIDRESAPYQAGGIAAMAVGPELGSAKLGPAIARGVDAADAAATKLAGKGIQAAAGAAGAVSKAGARLVPGVVTGGAAHMIGVGPTVETIATALGLGYGWKAKLGEGIAKVISKPFDKMVKFGQIVSDASDEVGTTLSKMAQKSIDTDLADNAALIDRFSAKLGSDAVDEVVGLGPSGKPLYPDDLLKPEQRQLRKLLQASEDLKRKRNFWAKLEDTNKILNWGKRFGMNTTAHGALGFGIGAGFAGVSSPPGDTESTRAGAVEMGMIGGLFAPLGAHAGMKEARFQRGFKAFTERGAQVLDPNSLADLHPKDQASLLELAGALDMGYGRKVIPVTSEEYQQMLPMPKKEGEAQQQPQPLARNAPWAHVTPEGDIVINKDAIKTGVGGHEFRHVMQKVTGQMLEKSDPEFMKAFDEEVLGRLKKNVGTTKFNSQAERDAEVGRIVLSKTPLSMFYGGEQGIDVLRRIRDNFARRYMKKWFNSPEVVEGESTGAGRHLDVPVSRADLATMREQLLKFGEQAAQKKRPQGGTPPPESGMPVVLPAGSVPPPQPAQAGPADISHAELTAIENALKPMGVTGAREKIEAAVKELRDEGVQPTLEEIARRALRRVTPKPLEQKEAGIPEVAAKPVSESDIDVPAAKGPEQGAAAAEPVSAPNDIKGRLAEANKAAAPAMRRARSPERRAEIARDARVEALQEMLPKEGEDLHAVEDPITGEVAYKGNVDPGNPVHQALFEEFGYTPEQIKVLTDLQNNQGRGVYLRRYNSAAQEGFEEGGADYTAQQRNKEYKASKPGDLGERKGEVTEQDKAVTPLGSVVTKKGVNALVFDHGKFLNNVRAILDAAHDAGIETGYEGLTGVKLDDELAADVRAVAANHAAGYDATGSKKLQVFPNMEPPKRGAWTRREIAGGAVDPRRAAVINAAFANQSARAPKPIKENKSGEPVAEFTKKQHQKMVDMSKEAQGLADLNQGYNNKGETNELRDELVAKGFDPSILKPTVSHIRPDLVYGGVHPEPSTEADIVHAHGFDIHARDLIREGLPRKEFVAAGFHPGPPDEPRRIIAAAVEDADGEVFPGSYHGDAIGRAQLAGAKPIEGYSDPSWDVPFKIGYMTFEGEFLTPKEAEKRAKEIGQVPKDLEPKPALGEPEERFHTRDFRDAGAFHPGGDMPAVESGDRLRESADNYVEKVGIPGDKGKEAADGISRTLSLDSDPALAAPYEGESAELRDSGGPRVSKRQTKLARAQQFGETSRKGFAALQIGDVAGVNEALAENKDRISVVMRDLVDGKIPHWDIKGAKIENPADLAALVMPLRTPWFESVKLVALDKNNRVLKSQILTVGTLNESILAPRDILRFLEGVKGKDKRLVVSHNHPSGEVLPSGSDMSLQQRIEEIARMAGVEVVDHVITNGKQYFSFKLGNIQDLAEPNTAPWEALPGENQPRIEGPDATNSLVSMLRQGNPDTMHVIHLNTKYRLTAIERFPAYTGDSIQTAARDMTQKVLRSIGREVPYAIIVDMPAKNSSLNLQTLRMGVGSQTMVKVLDVTWPGMHSAKAAGLLEDPGNYFHPGGNEMPTEERQKNFEKWTGGAPVVPLETSPYLMPKGDGPVVVEAVHGTTHDFNIFDPSKGNIQSDWGRGIYLSNTPEDVGHNYAGHGPDLTSRIANELDVIRDWDRPETFMDEFGMSEEEAQRYADGDATEAEYKALAKKKIAGPHEGATMKVYAKFEKPLKLGTEDEPYWRLDIDDESSQESGELMDLYNALHSAAVNYDDVKPQEAFNEIVDKVGYDGKASDYIEALRQSEAVIYATDNRDDFAPLAGNDFVRQVVEDMGYDGIIDAQVDKKFGSQRRIGRSMQGMHPDTVHYIAFKPEQIKSATGNRGTFDPNNPDITFHPGEGIPEIGSEESPERQSFFPDLGEDAAERGWKNFTEQATRGVNPDWLQKHPELAGNREQYVEGFNAARKARPIALHPEAERLLTQVPADVHPFIGLHSELKEALEFRGKPLTQVEGKDYKVTVIPSDSGHGEGIEIVESKRMPGFPVVTGRWMDYWEPYMKSEYGVSKSQYEKLPASERARIEAQNQADNWLDNKEKNHFADSFMRTYHPLEWDKWMDDHRRPAAEDPEFMEKPYGSDEALAHWQERANEIKRGVSDDETPMFHPGDEEKVAEPFYSQLTRTVQRLPQETMTVQQARALIEKGAKKDEISLSGLYTDPLSPLRFANDAMMRSPNDKVLKADLIGYALEREAKVQDYTFGERDQAGEWEPFKRGIRRKIGNRWTHIWTDNSDGTVYGQGPSKYMHRFKTVEEAKAYFDGQNKSAATRPTHFQQYTLPGADEGTYREMFVTAPSKFDPSKLKIEPFGEHMVSLAYEDKPTQYTVRGGRSDAELQRAANKMFFRDQWTDGHEPYKDVENPIVRIRRNIRTAPIEPEIKGKEIRNTGGGRPWKVFVEGEEEHQTSHLTREEAEAAVKASPTYTQPRTQKIYFIEEMQGPSLSEQEKMPPELRKRIYDIGFKRALRDAAAEGADSIAWTTGEQQTERYNLSKQVKQITATRLDDDSVELEIYAHDDTGRDDDVISRIVKMRDLPEFVGKDLAQKIADEVPVGEDKTYAGARDLKVWARPVGKGYGLTIRDSGENTRSIREATAEELPRLVGENLAAQIIAGTGRPPEAREMLSRDPKQLIYEETTNDDLKVGGEGLKRVYDKMLPSIANEIGKKFGTKVGRDILPGAEESVYQDASSYKWFVEDPNGHVDPSRPFNSKEEAVASTKGAIHTMPIPEALREHQMTEGNPLFHPGAKSDEEAKIRKEAPAPRGIATFTTFTKDTDGVVHHGTMPAWILDKRPESVGLNALQSEVPVDRMRLYDNLDVAKEWLKNNFEAFKDPKAYVEFMRRSGVKGKISIPPAGVFDMINDPNRYVGYLRGGYHGDKTVPGTTPSAIEGLNGVQEMRRIIGPNEAPPPFVVALHHLWGIVSRRMPPLHQEAIWLRLISYKPILDAIQSSIDGTFNLRADQWEHVPKKGIYGLVSDALRSTPGAETIGNSATSNANSFYPHLANLNGRWSELADVYKHPDSTSMGRAFWDVVGAYGTLGIRNKVQRFIGLTFGTPGVIMDRWKYVEFWLPTLMKAKGAATPAEYFKYSGNTPESPIPIYGDYGTLEAFNGPFSLALHEGIETALLHMIQSSPELRQILGAHADAGGLHWVGWNAVKNEPVGHTSLDLTKGLMREFGRDITADKVHDYIQRNELYTEGAETGNTNTRVYLTNGRVRVERGISSGQLGATRDAGRIGGTGADYQGGGSTPLQGIPEVSYHPGEGPNVDSEPWVHRYFELLKKEYPDGGLVATGKLTDAEELEMDRLHQQAEREYGSYDAFLKAHGNKPFSSFDDFHQARTAPPPNEKRIGEDFHPGGGEMKTGKPFEGEVYRGHTRGRGMTTVSYESRDGRSPDRYYTDNPVVAGTYGTKVAKEKIRFNNPLVRDARGKGFYEAYSTDPNIYIGDSGRVSRLMDQAYRRGHDGLIIKNVVDPGSPDKSKHIPSTVFISLEEPKWESGKESGKGWARKTFSHVEPIGMMHFHPGESDHPRAIKGPALRLPNGKVAWVAGNDAQHFHVTNKVDDEYGYDDASKLLAGAESGWVTNDGEFLDHDQAEARAIEMGQVRKKDLEEAKTYFGTKQGPLEGGSGLESLAFNRARKKVPPNVRARQDRPGIPDVAPGEKEFFGMPELVP